MSAFFLINNKESRSITLSIFEELNIKHEKFKYFNIIFFNIKSIHI